MTENGLAVLAEGVRLEPVEQGGKLWFTAEELGNALGYANPAHAVHKIFRQNQSELKHYSVETKTVSTDGKAYETRAFSREGALIISMLARTNQAKRVRAWLARLGDKAIDAALAQGRLEGREQAAKAIRGISPQVREIMPKALKYRRLGLTYPEIGKLVGASKHTVARAVQAAEILDKGGRS